MKFLNILILLLVALVALTSAQRCRGSPRNPSCFGRRNQGRPGRRCRTRTMWHFNAQLRRCEPMHYWGCAGNNNRWCTQNDCQQRCLRR